MKRWMKLVGMITEKTDVKQSLIIFALIIRKWSPNIEEYQEELNTNLECNISHLNSLKIVQTF